MRKMLFIYNPRAGTGQVRSNLSYILEEFARHDLEITVHPTQYAKDAQDTTCREAGNYDLIVCSGGDGTLEEVAAGLMEGGRRTPIGYIPSGSTNDFASSLGIPKQMRLAAAGIATGEIYPVDLGKLNDKYFIYVAAFGAFTEVSYATSQQSKNTIGHLAYLLAGVKSLSTIKGWKLTYRSQEMSGSGDFIYGMVTNSNSVGGFKGITGREVTLNDGLMEVTLIRMPDLFTEYPLIANALINDVDNKYIVKFKTTRIEFWSSEDIEIPWTTDGEYGGSHKHIVIEDLYRALPIVLGEQPADVIYEEDRREEENYRKPRDENGKVTGN